MSSFFFSWMFYDQKVNIFKTMSKHLAAEPNNKNFISGLTNILANISDEVIVVRTNLLSVAMKKDTLSAGFRLRLLSATSSSPKGRKKHSPLCSYVTRPIPSMLPFTHPCTMSKLQSLEKTPLLFYLKRKLQWYFLSEVNFYRAFTSLYYFISFCWANLL